MRLKQAVRLRIVAIHNEKWRNVMYLLSQKRCGAVLQSNAQILTKDMLEQYFATRYA